MFRFTVHRFEIGGRHCLLLPKLNRAQFDLLRVRLKELGYSIGEGVPLSARSPGGSLHVAQSGICWGTSELADVILPAMPALLRMRKDSLPRTGIEELYVSARRGGGGTLARLSTRLEGGTTWARLRSSGDCALAPDEHLVATRLLASIEGPCRVLTDFPTEGSAARRFGRLTYFDSCLPGVEAAATLRRAGDKGRRNSYIPRDGVLSLQGRTLPTIGRTLAKELGEWCSFEAAE